MKLGHDRVRQRAQQHPNHETNVEIEKGTRQCRPVPGPQESTQVHRKKYLDNLRNWGKEKTRRARLTGKPGPNGTCGSLNWSNEPCRVGSGVPAARPANGPTWRPGTTAHRASAPRPTQGLGGPWPHPATPD